MTGKGLAATALALMVMGAMSAWGWLNTPQGAEIAVHWSASGEVNRTGGKLEAFLTLPGLTLLVGAILAAAPHIDPRGRNLKASGPALLAVWMGVLALLTLTHAVLVFSATGAIDPSGPLVPRLVLAGAALLILVIGNVLGKARPNWFVGVRTPWTLSSDRAWDAAHRWAGRGFVASGLIGLAALILAPMEIALGVFLAAVLATAFMAVLISFLVWRKDPDRETYSEDG